MNKNEAKEIALRKLHHHKKQPLENRTVENLPDHLRLLVQRFHNSCPLCELFCYDPKDGKRCEGCPLTCPGCNDYTDEMLERNIAALKAWKCEAT